MNLSARIESIWKSLWSTVMGRGASQRQSIKIRSEVERRRADLDRLREALTGIIFQRKRLEDQLHSLDTSIKEQRGDLELAARQDRDEVAINLIAATEQLEEQRSFVSRQLEALNTDIEQAKVDERNISKDIDQAEQLAGALASRHEVLEVRKRMQQDLTRVRQSISAGKLSSLEAPLKSALQKLEAEAEVYNDAPDNNTGWQGELRQMKSEQDRSNRLAQLTALKAQLNDRTLPPRTHVPAFDLTQ